MPGEDKKSNNDTASLESEDKKDTQPIPDRLKSRRTMTAMSALFKRRDAVSVRRKGSEDLKLDKKAVETSEVKAQLDMVEVPVQQDNFLGEGKLFQERKSPQKKKLTEKERNEIVEDF